MELKDIEDFKNKYNADLFFNTDIKKLNWFNIGGKSKIFFKPKNLIELKEFLKLYNNSCLLYTSPSPRDQLTSRMPSSA